MIDSIFKIFLRTRSPFYLGRAILKKETRSYLTAASKTRKYLKKNYPNTHCDIPLSFVLNEKLIDHVPIGMLNLESIGKNLYLLNNPVKKSITNEVSLWTSKHCQVKDVV